MKFIVDLFVMTIGICAVLTTILAITIKATTEQPKQQLEVPSECIPTNDPTIQWCPSSTKSSR